MKKLILSIVGATLIFFSCEKNNCTAPQATDFTGTSSFVADISPGTLTVLQDSRMLIEEQTAEWYDSSGNKMVTGKSIWVVNWLLESDWSSGKLWGTAEIYVGVPSGGNNGDATGVWELTWDGQLTQGVFNPDIQFLSEGIISVTANGVGTSGDVKGKHANWTYSMDIQQGFVYNFTGSIL